MEYIGNIKLPVQGVQKVHGTDIEIMDYLFDMEIPKLHDTLGKVHSDDQPVLMVVKVGKMGFVGLFMYRPPDIWLDFDGQKYQLFLAPNLLMLISYWVDKRMRTQDLWEAQLLTKIIQYLDAHAQNQNVSHTL